MPFIEPSLRHVAYPLRVGASVLIILVMAGASMIQSLTPASVIFKDVPGNNPHLSAITFLSSEDIIQGYEDETFHPNRLLNRAEFVRMLVGAAGYAKSARQCIVKFRKTYGESALLFSDVPAGSWYEADLCLSLTQGIVHGFTDHQFAPDRNVTFVDAATMISRTFHLASDASTGNWYESHVKALDQKNAIPIDVRGMNVPVNRGVVAEMIYRIMFPITDRPSLSFDEVAAGTSLHAAAGSALNTAQEVLAIVNSVRDDAHLPPLRENFFLDNAAQAHAEDLARGHFLSHTSTDGSTVQDRILDSGYLSVDARTCKCKTWSYRYGEVIADDRDNAEEVITAFLNSPEHRRIILSPDFAEAGVGRSENSWVIDEGTITLH